MKLKTAKKSQVSGLKPQALFTIIILQLVLFSGCQPSQQVSDTTQQTAQAPIAIPGVWQTSGEHPWKLTLAADGTVTDVVRADGLHFVIADGRLELQPAENIYAEYVFGPCLWDFDLAARRLEVILTVDDMVIRTDQKEFKCSFVDEFSGPVFEDGKTWTPEWILTQKYAPPRPDQVYDYKTQEFTKTE